MKILFLGTHGQYNIGDELLLETFLTQLGREHEYAVNSYDPAFTAAQLGGRFKVEVFHTTQELPRFFRKILWSDAVVFGGGSIIKELYASVGRNRYATLGMILGTVTFARQVARKPVIMSNIGIGPLDTPNGTRLARQILRQASLVSVRDEKSRRLYERILPQGKVVQVPDAVFANSPNVFAPLPHVRPAGGPLRVALNLNYDIENPAAWEPFQASLAETLCRWNERQPLTLFALPMQSRFKAHDDLTILREFHARIPKIPMEFCAPQTAAQAGEIIANSDVVVAERLHTLVISAILGKPFFGMLYDVKVRELVTSLGMQEFALDINKPFAVDTMLEKLDALWNCRVPVSSQLVNRSTALHSHLDTYFADVRRRLTMPA